MRTGAAVLLGALLASATCVGVAASAEAPGRPIAGAGEWRLIEPPDPAACSARLQARPGASVDTMLLVNNDNKLVLVAGRRDWNLPPAEPKITLRVDNQPPRTVEASLAVNLVMLLVDDDAFYRQIRNARHIAWSLPMGEFSANVGGLGPAFDAALACKRAHPAATR